ncbi:MAG: phosphoribosylglycinamide formyltransferase, partial [bacterium]
MTLVGNQYRIAVFLSGKGSNFEALLKATRQREVPGRIVLVVSNNPDAGGVQIARREGIAVEILRRDDFPDGATFAWKMLSQLRRWQVDVICLAGYMKKIPSIVVRAYRNRILNIHPALLPKFGGKGMYGLKVHQAVLDAKEKESGVTIHLVDEIYDHGPILA